MFCALLPTAIDMKRTVYLHLVCTNDRPVNQFLNSAYFPNKSSWGTLKGHELAVKFGVRKFQVCPHPLVISQPFYLSCPT